jgi:succinyl-diaminopimelate desuccinylase
MYFSDRAMSRLGETSLGEDMDIKKEFEKKRESFISDLQNLIRIPSVAGEAEGEYPFGRNVQDALEFMLGLGRSMGFEVKNVDNYGAHIDFPGSEAGIMAVVGHVDVVPEGDGWTHDPFGGELADGWIYGRGTQDDKGPTLVGLYAMKVLKDLGFKPKKTVRLILGLDEEDSWNGMKYYLEHEPAPDFGIVPDADFPLVQCEKGLLEFYLVMDGADRKDETVNHGLILKSFIGGTAANVVAGRACIQVSGDTDAIRETEKRILAAAAKKEYQISTSIIEEILTVELTGVPSHAAFPERGKNAISMMMDLLGAVSFTNQKANELIGFYNDLIGLTFDGSRMGCAMTDDLSGALTFNVGKINFDSNEVKITVDIRYPVTKSQGEVCEKIEATIRERGFHMQVFDHIKAIYQESDHPVVVTLIDIYRKISGDMESRPTAIGGATFARAIPNCMAFGALFPGDPELEHQKDEKIELSQLIKAGVIYAEAIRRLAE